MNSAGSGNKKRLVILGGGFAGMYAAMQLDKKLARRPDFEVILIDRQNFFLFTPMLHEVAASDLDITAIVNSNRHLLKHCTFLQAQVESVDLPGKQLVVTHCDHSQTSVIKFDYLLVALGASPNFYNLPGLEENALTMQSLSDALTLRNTMIESLEEAEVDAYTGSKPLLTFVAAGAGFAGVETAAAMNDFLRESIKFYPHLTEDMVKLILVHDGPYILPELGEELGKYAFEKLSERKVEIMLDTKVTGYSQKGVELSNGQAIRSVFLVWTAGVTANALVRTFPCKIERGRLVANQFLEVEMEGEQYVWACGDCAYIVDPKTGKPYPPTAQHASRQGKVVAQNIEATIFGGNKDAFIYASQGQLAAIGRRTGVANIMGFKFSGFIAWVLWRCIYLAKLPRFEHKLRVAIDWTLDMIFPKDLVQFTSRQIQLAQNEEYSQSTGLTQPAPTDPGQEPQPQPASSIKSAPGS